jgi:carboxymethylenebutenolidase
MRKLDAELTRLGKAHQFYTYPGANHAFMDHTGQRYVKSAADASWPRTLEFFATHLKKAPARARS